MNIFKILSSGDGKLSEPNISALLGYLLNPNEDHGLGSIFLSQILLQHAYNNPENTLLNDFINNVNKDIEYAIDFSSNSDYRIDIFLEQAFKSIIDELKLNKEKEEKGIVDIVLFIYKIKYERGKKKNESIILNQISQNKELKHIILMEIKINDNSSNAKKHKNVGNSQLVNQLELTYQTLEYLQNTKNLIIDFHPEALQNISMIFIAPNEPKSNRLYNELKNKKEYKTYPKSFIYWKEENEENEEILKSDSNKYLTVENILEKIINNDFAIKNELIPEYTSQTLQSFANFIFSDFSPKNKKHSIRIDITDKSIIRDSIKGRFPLLYNSFDEIISYIEKIDENIILKMNCENGKNSHIVGFWLNGIRLLRIEFSKAKYDFVVTRKQKGAEKNEYSDKGIIVEPIKSVQSSRELYWKIKDINKFSEMAKKAIEISYKNVKSKN